MRSPFHRRRIRREPLSPWRRHDPAWMLVTSNVGPGFSPASGVAPGFSPAYAALKGGPTQRGMAGVGAAPSAAAAAIAQAEGYGIAGNIPTTANNPGDLVLGNIGYGTTGAAGGVQITNFPNPAAGYAALQNQINAIDRGTSTVYPAGATIAQVSNIYSGSTSGAWGNNVASILGVTPDTPFSAIAGSSSAATPSTSIDLSDSTDASDDGTLSSLMDTGSDNTTLYVAAGIAAVALAAFAFF